MLEENTVEKKATPVRVEAGRMRCVELCGLAACSVAGGVQSERPTPLLLS